MDDGVEHWQDKCERYISGLIHKKSASCNAKATNWKEDDRIAEMDKDDHSGTHMEKSTISKGSRSMALHVSLHGFPFLLMNRNSCSKFMWTVVTLTGCGTFAVMGYIFISQYILQKHTAAFSYDRNDQRFPAVTVCNANILRKSLLSGTVYENLTDLDNNPPDRSPELTPPESQGGNTLTYSNPHLYNFTQQIGVDNINELISQLSEKFQRVNTDWMGLYTLSAHTGFTELRNAVRPTPSHLKSLGHHPLDTLAWGHFEDDLVKESDVKETIHHKYGRCVSITNSEKSASKSRDILTLALNLQADEYLGFLYPSVGAFVFIQEADDAISELSPLMVSPGEWTTIRVRRQEIRKPSPCKYEAGYALQNCRLACFHRHVRSLCGCNHGFDDQPGSRCSATNRDDYICTGVVSFLHKTNNLVCECPEKCREIVYKAVHSRLKWPSEKSMTHFTTEMTSHGFRWNQDVIRQNIARVTIGLDRSFTENIEITPEVSVTALMVKLGGASALLCGLSLVTVLELLWMVCVASVSCCRRQNQRRKMQKYVQHFGHDTPSSVYPADTCKSQKRPSVSHVVYRKDSKSVRKMTPKKRLGANRRPLTRTGSGAQNWGNLGPILPIRTSTFRYRRNNNSSGESGVASGNRLVSKRNSSEEPCGTTEQPHPVGGEVSSRNDTRRHDLIVPRLNLEDLISHAETEEFPSTTQGYTCDIWRRESTKNYNHVPMLHVPSPVRMNDVFREIERRRSNVGEGRRPVYTSNGNEVYRPNRLDRY